MGKTLRVSRLLEMVSLLQAGPGWSAPVLAERFGVSRTRVFNDIRALKDAGVPIRRSQSGYRIDPSFFLPSVRLTPQEVAALLFPGEAFLPAEHRGEVLQSARSKLLSCLPPVLRASAEGLMARTSVALPTAGVNPAVFAEVRDAVAQRRRIAIIYSGRRTEALRRLEVDAYGVAFRKHAWYLVAYSVTHREIRKFRVSRISAVEHTPLHFTAPKDFSLEGFFEGSWYVFGGEPQEIGIRFAPSVARLIRERVPHPGQAAQTFSDGTLFYRAQVRNLDEVAWWLVQYGAAAEAVYPPALREKVVALALGVLCAHGVATAQPLRPYPDAPTAPTHIAAEPDSTPPPPPRA
ncbi:MAG TPA: WYL domain-containing protein [Planctomycetota bacterium]|nr:WYL domain-containing protein [Planctomycetota bacterium]